MTSNADHRERLCLHYPRIIGTMRVNIRRKVGCRIPGYSFKG